MPVSLIFVVKRAKQESIPSGGSGFQDQEDVTEVLRRRQICRTEEIHRVFEVGSEQLRIFDSFFNLNSCMKIKNRKTQVCLPSLV